jgi:hypothetical protein
MKFLRNQLIPVLLLLAFTANATVYNVTPAGAGLASLTGAVNNAAATVGPHTINLAAGTYTIAAALNFGTLANQNISFIGAGAGSTTITVSGSDRIMNIGDGGTSGVSTSVQGITFSGVNFTLDFFGGAAIIAGGPGNTLNIANCVFTNCKLPATGPGGKGGAVAMMGGGALNITGSTFTGNSVINTSGTAGGAGGAVYYLLPNTGPINGSVSITGSTFTNNGAASNSGGQGGAIQISAGLAVGAQAFSVLIQKNNFTLNHADNAGSTGGAIRIDNSFGVGNTADVRFNRFVGNTASNTASSAVAMAATSGSVNVSNCWWGCNTGAASCADKAGLLAAGGAGVLTATPYLTLTNTATSTALCNAAPNNTSVITASFLVNSAGTTLTTSDIAALIGLPVTFNGGASGSISGAQATIQASGTATATYTATTGSGAGGTATVDAGTTTSVITVAASTLPTSAAATTITQNATANSNYYSTGCSFIAKVVPIAPTPISGNVTAKVWVETSVPKVNSKPFVARHYEITPAAGAATATGTVTLYFTQAEFNAFNADPLSTLDLPTGSGDNAGKANLRIGKFGGTSNNGTGMPGTYIGGLSTVIDPPDANIVFNSGVGRWEVTFDVAGFSGFVVQTTTAIIPVRIASFTGKLNADKSASLYWNVENQLNVEKYIVEKSIDRINFTDIGTVQANTLLSAAYTFRDPAAGSGNIYYRIRSVDLDTRTSRTDILVLNVKNDQSVFLYPNPVAGSFTLQTTGAYINESATLLDANGRVIKTVKITGTLQTVNMEGLGKGLYLLRFTDGNTYKITKQ